MLNAVTRDGRIFVAEHQIVAERQHDQWVFGATIRPLENRELKVEKRA